MNRPRNKKTALVTAVDYLARRAHTEKDLRTKLLRKGYAQEEIDAAAATLKQRGYLDDRALCQSLAETYLDECRLSVKAIRYKLTQKGFARDVIDACTRGPYDERERLAAAKVLRMKYRSPEDAEPQQMMKYLYAKGFESSVIRSVVANSDFDEC